MRQGRCSGVGGSCGVMSGCKCVWFGLYGRPRKQCLNLRCARSLLTFKDGTMEEETTPGDDDLHERRRARIQAERADGWIQLENHRATRFQNGVRTHQPHSIFFHAAVRRNGVCLLFDVEGQVRGAECELVDLASVLSWTGL